MQSYSVERLEAAIAANKDGAKPNERLVKRDDDYRVVTFDTRTGLRYPVLERIEGSGDRPSDVLAAK